MIIKSKSFTWLVHDQLWTLLKEKISNMTTMLILMWEYRRTGDYWCNYCKYLEYKTASEEVCSIIVTCQVRLILITTWLLGLYDCWSLWRVWNKPWNIKVFLFILLFLLMPLLQVKKIMSTPSPRPGVEQNMALDSCPCLKMPSFLHLVTTLVLSCT